MKDWLGLSGKVCVVTGAAGGIGVAIAKTLSGLGAKVALIDRTVEACAELQAEIAGIGGTAISFAADIADPQSVEACARAASASLGLPDVLVNNAAIIRPGGLADLSLEDWNDLLAVNLTGFFVCSQIFGRTMRERGSGSIIHIASLSGVLHQGYSGAYSVSKAGVLMLSRGLAAEWGASGVRSNAVCPAMVHTPMTASIYADPQVKMLRENAVPLRRIGTPQDTADAVAFLASDRAAYITGEEIRTDGGFSQNTLALVPRPGFEQSA